MKIEKENKYIVIKRSDLDDFQLTAESPFSGLVSDRGDILITPKEKEKMIEELKTFYNILDSIENENKYIVCNQDEPYAELVWQIILGGEALKKCKQDD